MSLTQNGGQTEVTIIGSGSLTYHSKRLQNPERLVLDFAGSHLATSEKHIASNLDPVREIRLAQFTPEVSRVVIDLRSLRTTPFTQMEAALRFRLRRTRQPGSVSPASDSAPIVSTKSVAPRRDAELKSAAVMPTSIPTPAAFCPSHSRIRLQGLQSRLLRRRQEGRRSNGFAHDASSTWREPEFDRATRG